MSVFFFFFAAATQVFAQTQAPLAPATKPLLCGNWVAVTANKCPFVDACGTAAWRNEITNFFGDGTFTKQIVLGPGVSSCNPDSGTNFLKVTTVGDFVLGSVTGTNRTKITYNARGFKVLIPKDKNNAPYGGSYPEPRA